MKAGGGWSGVGPAGLQRAHNRILSGRAGDCGVLAYEHPSGRDIGVAWLRLWAAGDTGYGFVDSSTPELSMAVRLEWRGRGVGTLMLKQLFAKADQSYAAVSLSVSDANPAARLYERFGFAPVTSLGGSTTMRRRAVRPSRR